MEWFRDDKINIDNKIFDVLFILIINFFLMEGLIFLFELSIFIWFFVVKNEIWVVNIVIDKNNFNDKCK